MIFRFAQYRVTGYRFQVLENKILTTINYKLSTAGEVQHG